MRTGSARSLSSPSVERSASDWTTALFISMLRFALLQKTAAPEFRTTKAFTLRLPFDLSRRSEVDFFIKEDRYAEEEAQA